MSAMRCVSVAVLLLFASLPALAETATHTGAVLGPDGRPVAGARVLAREGGSRLVEVATDNAGRFRIEVEVDTPDQAVSLLAMHEGLAMTWGKAKPGVPISLSLSADAQPLVLRVVTAEGQPVAGARVEVGSLSPDEDGGGLHLSLGWDGPLNGATDGAGQYRIAGVPPYAKVWCRVVAEGRAMAATNVGGGYGPEVAVVLAPEGRISGRVLRDGQPVPDAVVRARRDDPVGGQGSDEARTGPDGAYTLHHLPAGTYAVVVTAQKGLVAHYLRGVKVEAGAETTGQELQFIPAAVVRGKVTEERSGEPVAGIRLDACGVDPPGQTTYAFTGTDGAYELLLLPGPATVQAAGGRMYSPVAGAKRELELTEEQVVEGVDFAVKPPAEVAGVVLTAAGQPAAGAHVWFGYSSWEGGGPTDWDLVQPNGTFALQTWAESLERGGMVVASDPARGLIGIAPFDAKRRVLEMALRPGGYLLGSAHTQDGRPVPAARFSVRFHRDQDPWTMLLEVSAYTDAEGRVCLGPLPPGLPGVVPVPRTWLDYAVGERWWEEGTSFTLQPGEQRTLPPLIVDLAGRQLRVTVTDAGGTPVPEAQVFAPGQVRPAVADATGTVLLSRLPTAGQVLLVAAHPRQAMHVAAEVDPATGAPVTLALRPPVRLTGVLHDDDGRPVTGAQVAVSLSGRTTHDWSSRSSMVLYQQFESRITRKLETTSDEDGRFSVEGLVAGLIYTIAVRPQDDKPWGLRDITIGTKDTHNLGALTNHPPRPAPPVGEGPGAPKQGVGPTAPN